MGISKDINRLKANGSAVAGELNEFLGQMRGKPPQEVLGVIAQSGLTQGIVMATAATFVLMAVFTVVPYFYTMAFAAAQVKNLEKIAATGSNSVESDDTPTKTQEPAISEADPDLAGAADKMGINETRESDPGVNPLEGKMDNLLDDLK